jgi:O-antigen ligase
MSHERGGWRSHSSLITHPSLLITHHSSLFTHPSLLIRSAAVLYILHFLFQPKPAGVELGAFFTILLTGWAVARGDARFSWHILYFPLVLYGIATTVSAILAERHIHNDLGGILWFKMLIFPAAVILYRELPRLREAMVHAFVLFGGGLAVWGLIEFFLLGMRDLDRRMNGPTSHVMTYSNLVLPMALIYLIFWLHERKWWQLGLTLLITFALFLTLTRSVWLGWAAAIFVLFMITKTQIRYFVPAALVLFVSFMPMAQFSRLMSTFDLKEESNFDRVRMLEAGVEMIKDFPVFGVGPANVKEVYSLYKKQDAPRIRPAHLHNNVIQIWAERGILGLIGYLLLLALFLRECARARNGPGRMWADMGIAITVGWFVAGLFEFNFGDTEVFYLTLNLFALIVTAVERPEPLTNEVAGMAVPAPA